MSTELLEKPRRLHSHPIEGRVIVLHLRDEDTINAEHPGHAWGPFANEAEAREWQNREEDDCYSYLVELIEPI